MPLQVPHDVALVYCAEVVIASGWLIENDVLAGQLFTSVMLML